MLNLSVRHHPQPSHKRVLRPLIPLNANVSILLSLLNRLLLRLDVLPPGEMKA